MGLICASKVLQRELLDSPVDVVYIDHLGMARYLPEIKTEHPLCRLVLDQHNVESDFFKQFADMKAGGKKLVAQAEWRAAVRFETRTLKTVTAVVAISQEDARRFEALSGVRAYVAPVVMTSIHKTRSHIGRPHFCYVGNLRWQPNVEGLNWLCQHVWPKVLARVPDATLEIAGVGLSSTPAGGCLCPGCVEGSQRRDRRLPREPGAALRAVSRHARPCLRRLGGARQAAGGLPHGNAGRYDVRRCLRPTPNGRPRSPHHERP